LNAVTAFFTPLLVSKDQFSKLLNVATEMFRFLKKPKVNNSARIHLTPEPDLYSGKETL
jgi:hypothetical protein